MKPPSTDPPIDLKRSAASRRGTGLALLAILAALVACAAYGLAQWRSSEREDAEASFRERSMVVASQLEAVLASSRATLATGIEEAVQSGSLDRGDLAQATGVVGQVWVLDRDGKVMLRSPGASGAPLGDVDEIVAAPEPRASGVMRAGGRQVVEFNVPVSAPGGVGAVVVRYPVEFVAGLITSAIDRIPATAGMHATVVDDDGGVLVSAGESPAGTPLGERGLDLPVGEVEIDGEDQMYASSVVANSPWRVVLAAPRSEVLAQAGGPAGWVGWAVLAAFTVTGFAAILLVLRVNRDTEKLAAFSENLEQRQREAEESTRAKNDFISGIAHELRTPLAAIRMFTDLMRNDKVDPLSPGQMRTMDDISSSVTHLMDLLNDTMDIARVEQGKLPLRPERVSAAALAIGVVDGVQPLAVQRGLRLTLDADGRIGEVFIDPARLRQVMINFLSNALKFTPPGGSIAVRISRHGPSSFVIAVEDTGIGMSAEDADRVFTANAPNVPPVRDEDTTRGLGLALTRRIVEAMGGHVGVESELGSGSTFFAVLPRVNAERFAGIDPSRAANVDSVLRAPPPAAGAADRRISSRGPRGAEG